MITSAKLSGAIAAALSRGPGYEPQPRNEFWGADRSGCPYYLDLRLKTLTSAVSFSSGRGQRFPIGPATLAQRALGWHERFRRGDEAAGSEFISSVEQLVARAERAGDELRWRYDIPIEKYGLERGWLSGLAQGQAASALTRAYVVTGDDRYAFDAVAAINTISERNALLRTFDGALVIEEYPTADPSAVLNGWIYALWGLLDVATVVPGQAAQELLAESLAGLEASMLKYEFSRWSLYSRFPLPGKDLAKPFYHRLHVAQVAITSEIADSPRMASVADRWARYDTSYNRTRIVAKKARSLATAR